MKRPVTLTRRMALLGLAAAAVASPASAASARARIAMPPGLAASLRFRAIKVDTSGLAANGLPNYAERVRRAAQPFAQATFADRYAPGDKRGATMIVHIDTLTLGSDGSGHSRGTDPFDFRLGGDDRDWIEGGGTVIGADGRVIADYPIFTSQSSDSIGPWYLPENEQRRMENLTKLLAAWVKSEMGL